MALNTSCQSSSQQAELIKSVMKLKPSIEEIHKGPIAALRLKSPTNYAAVIKAYPELKVNAETEAKITKPCVLF